MNFSASIRRSPRRALHVALALAQVGLFAIFARPWRIIDGFPLDDAWIHQVVARTFATTGTLGYAPGQSGAAATSYLWAALLSVNFRFVHADPAAFTLALNGLLAFASGQLLLAILLRDSKDRPGRLPAAFVSALLACEGGNFVWFAFSGMEATLVVFLVLLAVWGYATPPGRPAAWRGVLTGLAAALLAIARPEAGTLGPFLALAGRPLGRSRGDALRVALTWALGPITYVTFNLVTTGVAAPATLAGRRWLWLEGSAALSRATVLWEFACDWLLRLRNGLLGTSATVLLWLALGLGAHALVQWARRRERGTLLIAAWTAIHVGTYAVLMPVAGHGGRYQPLVPVVFLLALARGSVDLVGNLADLVLAARGRSWLARIVPFAAAAPWVALVGVGLRDWGDDNAKAVQHIRATECAIGEAINDLPPGKAASFDIGCSGFYASRGVIDIGGLSNPKTAELMKEGRIWEYLRDENVAYVALPLAYEDHTTDPVNFAERLHLSDNLAVHLEPLRFFETPFHIWEPGVVTTQNAAPRQGLFRITYTGASGPKPGPVVRAASPPLEGGDHVYARDRVQLEDSLRIMAGAGVPVHMTITDCVPVPAAAPGAAWEVSFGPCGATATPPANDKVPESAALALVAQAVRPYLDRGNLGGAGESVLEAIAHAERRWGTPRRSRCCRARCCPSRDLPRTRRTRPPAGGASSRSPPSRWRRRRRIARGLGRGCALPGRGGSARPASSRASRSR